MKPLPSRPDPSLTERTPQRREERGVSLADFQRVAHLVERVTDALYPILGADMYVKARPYVDGWSELTVTALVSPDGVAVFGPPRPPLRVWGVAGDRNPMPRFRLFRWLP